MASPDDTDAQFEWDNAKAIANLEKHGVSFREASEIFDDGFMQLMYDDDHSDSEERFIAIGMSKTTFLNASKSAAVSISRERSTGMT